MMAILGYSLGPHIMYICVLSMLSVLLSLSRY